MSSDGAAPGVMGNCMLGAAPAATAAWLFSTTSSLSSTNRSAGSSARLSV